MGWAKYSEDNHEINSERISYIYRERSTPKTTNRYSGLDYDIDDLPDKNFVSRRKRPSSYRESEKEPERRLSYGLIYVNGRFVIDRPLNPGYGRC